MSKLRKLVEEIRVVLEMDSSNVGVYVRPAGPILPPAPLPGYEYADEVMFKKKRKRLDSKPK